MKTIRRRAVIKSLGESHEIKMRYRRLSGKKYRGYIVETNDNSLGDFIIKDDVRVLRWEIRFPYIKDVLKSYYESKVWVRRMSEDN